MRRTWRQRFLTTTILGAGLFGLAASPAFAQRNPERNAYFGQTHQHTSWSLDAYIIGNTLAGPEDAYKYAIGQPIRHPAGYMIKIGRPLDFEGVTDHSEYAGMMSLANDPSSPISKLPIAQKLKAKTQQEINKVFQYLAASIAKQQPIKELTDPKVAGTVWQQNNAIADKYNKPGKFTTFCAYEWTSMPNNQNMHRNVFFKDCAKVPVAPFSALDSDKAEDLWAWMNDQRKAGNEVLAISHNANLSNGLMFPVDVDGKGRPIDSAWARERLANEPLTEIKQVKGTSETHPDLSPNDEFANFEIMNYLIGIDNSSAKLIGGYARQAYLDGLAMQDARGYNPYKFGFVGAGDSHNTAANFTQSNYFGDHGLMDATPQSRLAGRIESGMNILETGTSGLGGVWAEENTRASIFEAMQRKETFGTSGVRIKVRLFGGWEYQPEMLKQKDWVKVAYAGGVPMGGDLPAVKGKAPSFIVQAVKDPEDGNLDRIQIVKGWTKNGQTFEKIYDVAWSGGRKIDPATGKLPPVGNTVDILNATYKNTIGAVELKQVWTDPDFDPALQAVYYARVLQIPTPRWSTYDAKKLGVLPPSNVASTIQERAWTSPIWYTPSETARATASRGLTVAELKQRGAMALDEAQLKEFALGKTLKVRNTVTGKNFDILYGADGRRVVTEVADKAPSAAQSFEVMHNGVTGSTATYIIRDGQLVTTIDKTPFAVTVYKLDDKYFGARSNEFGYVNYEVEEPKIAN
ncbi:DUF3604 domain-containing protein [Bradyrhizobium sp. WSM 1738]|uniref:DUF3604 domain-containing protein n=1 Tax=Bradyrhizobium hereditatis TaxID=2821405 RepID=UPI001CE2E343|nr:DUF3604 domain-containing protein [Bradyrhizobium hereditatis]MCA6118155.1 DUF3604 domain-containing protein [Bradyrhizobium hereditatis]